MKRNRERDYVKFVEEDSWREFRNGQDLVRGDGLDAPRKSAKSADRIKHLSNTGEWKPRSEFDSRPKSEIPPPSVLTLENHLLYRLRSL